MPPRRAVAASPARSTRSTRSNRNEEDEENESVQSSFKVPSSKSKSNSKANSTLGLKDTSVNVAAAFHAAQTGNYPTPTSDRPFIPASRKAPSKSPIPPPHPLVREKSPAEQLADSARALSPVRYFLRQTDDGVDDYPSFSSLASGVKSAETSYDYRQEEEYVRHAAKDTSFNGHVNGKRGVTKKRIHNRDEDLPYRPGEDDWAARSDESGEEGEGIVRNGGLNGRAGTRGTRKEKGEGYLGMGLGIQPRRRGRKSNGDEGDYDDYNDGYSNREITPAPSIPVDVHSPNGRSRFTRSPTPAQVIARAFSPIIERRPPGSASRKRQPSTGRTVVTNLLHGLALALRFLVEAVGLLLDTLLIRPFRAVFGSGKQFLRSLKTHWWKWFFGILATSLILRLSDAAWQSKGGYAVPNVPPGSMEELVGRLLHLEQAVSLLSDSSKLLADAEKAGKQVDDDIMARVTELEGSLSTQRKRLDDGDSGNNGKSDHSDKLRSSLGALKKEVGDLSGRIGSTEKQWKGASSKFDKIDSVDRDVQGLRKRVDEVETSFKAILEDGRLRTAMERILPAWMPLRKSSTGGLDIDPVFWTEMRKVLVGKGEVESMIRSTLAEVSGTPKSDKDLEAWGERFMARKRGEGVVISRAEFTEQLESEVLNLKEIIAALPRHQAQSAPTQGKSRPSSAVTIKSAKGEDVTSLLQDLIDAALLRYSKDTIARRDYALFSAGARVIPDTTSQTLVMSQPNAWRRIVKGEKPVEGRSPATALTPDNAVGQCWPFQGSEGQLGILLNRRVVISDITIEHASSDVALDISTAPKEVEVWGHAEDAPTQAKIADYHARNTPETEPMPATEHILLGSFTYDPSAPSHIQTFPIKPDILDLGIELNMVTFMIKSNWGGDFTCLYRVRVHGEAV